MNHQEKKNLKIKIFAGVLAFVMIASAVASVLIYILN